MRRRILPVLLVSAAAWAAGPLTAPRVGLMSDGAGGLRPVLGLAANFVLGPASGSGVVSVASSARFGLVKTEDTLWVEDERGAVVRTWMAPSGKALLAFYPSGEPALAFFPSNGTLQRLDLLDAIPLALDPAALGGEAIALAAEPGVAKLLVRREDGFRRVDVSLENGGIVGEDTVEGIAGPALATADGGLVFSQGCELVLNRVAAEPRRVTLEAPAEELTQMGDGWVLVRLRSESRSDTLHKLVRFLSGREEVYTLPEARP